MVVFIQRDAPLAVQDLLDTAPFLDGVKITSNTDHTYSIHEGPYVLVDADGTPSAGRATATENVRVAVFSKYRPEARSLCAWIDAFLQNPAHTTGFTPAPGGNLFVAPDDVTGGFVASITVRWAAPKIGVK